MKKWKKILSRLSNHFSDFENAQVQRKLSAYAAMKGHEGWDTHTEMLMLLRGALAEDMLSNDFTVLESTEKDIRQRAYAMTDQMIRFLLNPLAKAEQRAKFIQGVNREMTDRK